MKLPEEIQDIVKDSFYSENIEGCTESKVFHYSDVDEYGNLCLKYKPYNELDDFKRESNILNWLKDKLPVPEVVEFIERDGIQYILMTEIPGKSLSSMVGAIDDRKLIEFYAQGLKRIHEINISLCQFKNLLNKKISIAKRRVDRGLVNKEEFEERYSQYSAKELFNLTLDTYPDSEDLVFTHGDYCIPNILLNNNEISGFVDWSRGGIADRYMDLALAIRSAKFNFKKDYSTLFFHEYGLDKPDQEKIDFYILLDEFF